MTRHGLAGSADADIRVGGEKYGKILQDQCCVKLCGEATIKS